MTAKELRANKGCIYHFESYKNAHSFISSHMFSLLLCRKYELILRDPYIIQTIICQLFNAAIKYKTHYINPSSIYGQY